MTRFDRIETEAEAEAARREMVRLAFTERRPTTDPERMALQDVLHDFAMRQGAKS
jgi:hypothetical protein